MWCEQTHSFFIWRFIEKRRNYANENTYTVPTLKKNQRNWNMECEKNILKMVVDGRLMWLKRFIISDFDEFYKRISSKTLDAIHTACCVWIMWTKMYVVCFMGRNKTKPLNVNWQQMLLFTFNVHIQMVCGQSNANKIM